MAASLLSGSAGDEPTASVVVGAGLAIVRPVMSWKGRFNSKILLKLAKSIAQMANCPRSWLNPLNGASEILSGKGENRERKML